MSTAPTVQRLGHSDSAIVVDLTAAVGFKGTTTLDSPWWDGVTLRPILVRALAFDEHDDVDLTAAPLHDVIEWVEDAADYWESNRYAEDPVDEDGDNLDRACGVHGPDLAAWLRSLRDERRTQCARPCSSAHATHEVDGEPVCDVHLRSATHCPSCHRPLGVAHSWRCKA